MHKIIVIFWVLFLFGVTNGISQTIVDTSASISHQESDSLPEFIADSTIKTNDEDAVQDTIQSNKDTLNTLSIDQDTTAKNPSGFSLQNDKSLTKSNIDTSAVIYAWFLDKNYANPEQVDIDTSLVRFQVYNPVYRKYILPATLGNTGSAFLTLNFFERDYKEDLLFLHSYKGLFSTYDNTYYINTKKPFSHLFYFNGASKRNKEENIEIFHSQNVNPRFNFGFDLKILSDKGLYKYLVVKNKNFKAFTSYSGNRYFMHSTFNLNRYQSEENGGIIDSLFQNTDPNYTKLYDVNFTGGENIPYTAYVNNKVRYIDGMISQKVKLFTIGGNRADSSRNSKNMAEPTITHVFQYRRASKIYTESSENDPIIPIYNYTYTNPVETYDSIAQLSVSNRLQLDFKTKLGKVTAGIYGAIGHEYNKFTYYSLMDSTIIDTSKSAPQVHYDADGNYYYYNEGNSIYKYNVFVDRNNDTLYDINKNISISNLYIGGGIYGRFWTYFQGYFSAKLYFAGYKAGETCIDGYLLSRATIFSKPYQFLLRGSIENIKPSYQLNNYYSNNYIWEDKDFNFINRITLSSKIASPSNKFELSANYVLLRNYIYFNNDEPTAYNTGMNLFDVGVARDIAFWKFHFYNRIIYQVTENSSVVEVPTILLYNSTYFDHTWHFKLTGGNIRTMLGFDVRYSTNYFGYSYNPSLALFYQENNAAVGNYPFVDVWFNLRLKRTRFFAKFEHYNSTLWNRKDYYYAVSYPAKISTLKFGISWTFYD
jgi:hypothetical protein